MKRMRFSVKHSGRVALFGFALGAGVLLAGGAGVAAAAPGASDQGSGVSSSSATGPAAPSSVSRSHPADKATAAAPARAAAPPSRINREKVGPATEPSQRALQRAQAAQPVALSGEPSNQRAAATQASVTSGSAVEDPQSGLASLSADLARAHDGVPATAPSNPTVFGNFEGNRDYWYYQGRCGTCTLMSVAGVIGQLSPNHQMPTQQGIIDRASRTPSDVNIGQMIYEPESDGPNPGGKHTGASFVDAVTLLGVYDIDAQVTEYSRGQGKLAMDALKSSLSEGHGVIVNIHNETAYAGYGAEYFGSSKSPWGSTVNPISLETWGNHAVIVLEVDERHGMVYLNDSAPVRGQGLPVPLAAFMRAWQASRFQTITARPAAAAVAPQLGLAA